MTRFNISLEEGVNMVLKALEFSIGGEIFVPKIPSYRITDLAEAIAPGSQTHEIGIRPGEKLHEEMITESDSFHTIETTEHYLILPSYSDKKKYLSHYKATEVPEGFKYNSGSNSRFLSIEEIRLLIQDTIDPTFKTRQY